MTEEEKIEATAVLAARHRGLEFLFDYTKFHIGLYLTLTASYVAVMTAHIGDEPIVALRHPFWFWLAIALFMIAGLAGGVIASSITQTKARNTEDFLKEDIGPWEWKWRVVCFPARKWTWIEHTAFWLGLAAAIASLKPQ